jgi:hypothetical protein
MSGRSVSSNNMNDCCGRPEIVDSYSLNASVPPSPANTPGYSCCVQRFVDKVIDVRRRVSASAKFCQSSLYRFIVRLFEVDSAISLIYQFNPTWWGLLRCVFNFISLGSH